MKFICSSILLFLLQYNLLSQSINFPDELANTPFGLALKSNVHYINKSQYLNVNNDCIEVNSKSGNIIQYFNNKIKEKTKGDYTDTGWINGYITYAYGQLMDYTNQYPSYFSTNWTVPSPPLIASDQLIYLFIGLETIKYGIGHIVQPVLQWGISPAGGGKYWSICNWYVNNNQFFYDSLIAVNPGDNLEGVIQITSSSDTLFNYNSSFTGYSPGLTVVNLPPLSMPIIAFEAYNLDLCNEFSKDEKIRMRDIQINTDLPYTQVIWHSMNEVKEPVSKCGQFTKIINKSSHGGEIDIYFRQPSIDGFDEVQIYPNPVTDFVRISPNIIKSISPDQPDKPITNCKLEIFDSQGSLILTQFYIRLEQEFDLDMKNQKKGLYLIRFSYENRSHTLKIIKN